MSTLGRSGHSGSSPDLGSLLSGRGAPPGSLPGGSLLWCHLPSCSRGAERRGRHGVHGQLSAGRDRQVPLAESPPTRVSGLKPTSMSMPRQLGPSWGDTPPPLSAEDKAPTGAPSVGRAWPRWPLFPLCWPQRPAQMAGQWAAHVPEAVGPHWPGTLCCGGPAPLGCSPGVPVTPWEGCPRTL